MQHLLVLLVDQTRKRLSKADRGENAVDQVEQVEEGVEPVVHLPAFVEAPQGEAGDQEEDDRKEDQNFGGDDQVCRQFPVQGGVESQLHDDEQNDEPVEVAWVKVERESLPEDLDGVEGVNDGLADGVCNQVDRVLHGFFGVAQRKQSFEPRDELFELVDHSEQKKVTHCERHRLHYLKITLVAPED